MSLKNRFVLILVIFLSLSAILARPVSQNLIGRISLRAKMEKLFAYRGPANFSMSKAYPGGLSLNVTSDSSSIMPNQTFTLTASVSTEVATEDLRVQWDIPSNVEMLSGQLVQNFRATAGQTISSQVTLRTHDVLNHQIRIGVSVPNGESRKGMVTQFNTNPELLPSIHRRSLNAPPSGAVKILE
jgi:hypothetical protein